MSTPPSTFNVTTVDGVSSGDYALSQFFLVQQYGSSMKKFSMDNQLGAVCGALLAGYVWCETAQYYRLCPQDGWGYKTLVAAMTIAMTACQTIGVIDSIRITDRWNDYGNMIRTDELFRYTQLTLIAVVIGPLTFAFFGMRVWALQGKSILATIIFGIMLTAQIILGLITSVCGMKVPAFDVSEGLALSTLFDLESWSDRNFRMYQIWSIFTVISVTGVTLAILGTIWIHRTRDKTLNRMLWRLAISLLECMILPIAETLLFSITMIATSGIGGLTRIWGDIAAPFFVFAVVHALLDRGPMQQRLKRIGLNSSIDRSRDIESIPMPFLPALKVEPDAQVSSRDDDGNFWGKNVAANPDSYINVSSNRSDQCLTEGGDADSLDLTRKRIRQFHAAWEDPVANRVYYSNRTAWGFSLGSSMESA